MRQRNVYFGACGLAGCLDCRPIFDADNNPIPGTDIDADNETLARIIAQHTGTETTQ